MSLAETGFMPRSRYSFLDIIQSKILLAPI